MIELPITINEHGDETLFWSVDEAESYLEPVDVENNEYVATDGRKRALTLAVQVEVRRVFFGLIKVQHRVVKVLESASS